MVFRKKTHDRLRNRQDTLCPFWKIEDGTCATFPIQPTPSSSPNHHPTFFTASYSMRRHYLSRTARDGKNFFAHTSLSTHPKISVVTCFYKALETLGTYSRTNTAHAPRFRTYTATIWELCVLTLRPAHLLQRLGEA